MTLSAMQLDARKHGIGGSDAAAAVGMDPYKSTLQLWIEKRTPPPDKPTPAMRWGTLLEPVIREQYSRQSGRGVRVPEGTLYHPKYKFIIAHPDGLTDDNRLFEAKTARSPDGWGEPGSDQVPENYLLQVQHYLAVTALPVADVAVLIAGSDFRLYEVPADRELQEMVIDGEADFWQHVEQGEPPEPDYARTDTRRLLAHLYPGTNGDALIADEEQLRWYRHYCAARQLETNYKQAADAAWNHLLHEMADSAFMTFEDGRSLRRKLVKRKPYSVEATEYVDARLVKGGNDE
jgi:putative phage-type endonuclease